MSQKRARNKRTTTAPPLPESSGRSWRSWLRLAAGVLAIVAVAVGAAFALRPSAPAKPATALAGARAPAFSEVDVVSGKPVTSASLRGHNVLLFFSEGVMCQACFEQIQALQARAGDLTRRRLVLVNITTDPPSVLRQAAKAYGITTPLVSDEDRDMSRAYDVLGQGMHPDTAGHTFVLVGADGQVRWRRDYTTMYVPPATLLASLP